MKIVNAFILTAVVLFSNHANADNSEPRLSQLKCVTFTSIWDAENGKSIVSKEILIAPLKQNGKDAVAQLSFSRERWNVRISASHRVDSPELPLFTVSHADANGELRLVYSGLVVSNYTVNKNLYNYSCELE